jgi:hypothetical protein
MPTDFVPEIGKLYPALLQREDDENCRILTFPTKRARDAEMRRHAEQVAREYFPAFPDLTVCPSPVPVKVRYLSQGRVEINAGSNDWMEVAGAPDGPRTVEDGQHRIDPR